MKTSHINTKEILSYLKLHKSDELECRIRQLNEILRECKLCPRNCKVNRINGETGYCKAGKELEVASAFPHFGEERPLVGRAGSGTIFLAHCNLLCNFCQNYDISHFGKGTKVSAKELADLMIALQNQGCHNVNFVTPTHYSPQIMSALPYAIEMGFNLPIVYNCGGYESIGVIKLLDGIVDIYMPDVKFSNPVYANQFMKASDYFDVIRPVLREMHRQVGTLKIDKKSIAYRGLLIRHLVMPNDVAASEEIFKFISEELSKDSYINIMNQYRPCFEATKHSIINRPISSKEFTVAINKAKKYELHNGFSF